MFRFAYPGHRDVIPDDVLDELWARRGRLESLPARLCRGALVSREQYLVDISKWGYLDAREMPLGRMTPRSRVDVGDRRREVTSRLGRQARLRDGRCTRSPRRARPLSARYLTRRVAH